MKSSVAVRETDQVFIRFDGPGGLVIQTSMRTYEDFYAKLGWELLGPAATLPLYDDWGVVDK